jgi:hypothetical protein
MSEKDTQKLIIGWLNLRGHAVWLNEIPIGMPSARSSTGRRRPANQASSDIVGTLKGGRTVCIEVKEEKHREKITELWDNVLQGDYSNYVNFKCGNARDTQRVKDQAEFLLWQKRTGALAFFAFSLEDVQSRIAGDGNDNK